MNRAKVLRLAGVLGLAAVVVAVFLSLPTQDYFVLLLDWSEGLGIWAPVLIGAIYVPATILFIPGSFLSFGAGMMGGVIGGSIAVSLGSMAGASISFCLGRTLFRRRIEGMVSQNQKFQAIDRAVAREGFKIVLLSRLCPVCPLTLLNYAYGLTKVRFRDYFWGSWLGMLPGTFTYVYLGATAKSIVSITGGKGEGSMGETLLFGAGLMATLAVMLLITRIATKAIREAVPTEDLPEADTAASAME